MKFPHYRQLDQMDCGPTCLRMVAKHYGKQYTAQSLIQKSQISREGVSLLGIAEAAENVGFSSLGVKLSVHSLLSEAPLPCILHWGQNHFVVLYKITHRPSFLSKDFLNKVTGGKGSSNVESIVSPHSNVRLGIKDNILDAKEITNEREFMNYSFHIADPASGLIEFTYEEFKAKWLNSLTNHKREGIALLLEPTPRFFNLDDEKDQGIQIGYLLNYIWKYKRLIIQLLFGVLASSIISLILPLLTQSIVDVGIETHDISFINLILLGQLVLLISSTFIDFIKSWILFHISSRLNISILSEFLAKLMRLPLSFFDVKQFGDIMQRIGDHHRIEVFLTSHTLNVVFSIFNLFLFGFVLAYMHISIFIITIFASILYTFWVIFFLKYRRKLDVKRFQESSNNQSQIVQLIQAMQDIKLANAETIKRWEWERVQAKLFKWNIKNLSLSQIQQTGAVLINQGKNIIVTFLAAKAVVEADITLGTMISIQFIMSQFNAPVEILVSFLQSWQDAKLSLERLNEIHMMEDEEGFSSNLLLTWPKNKDIVFSNVFYTYPGAGNEPVIKNLNLVIPYGKTTAIVGTSGSGKTTLLKLVLRFYKTQKGVIELRNTMNCVQEYSPINFESISPSAWRNNCGVVMQEGFIFSDSIARNIAVGDEIINEPKLFNAAKIANIHDFISSLPLGYHTKIGSEGNGISQGQKQRILIARAVYKDPDILLFDEATNALDANNEAKILSHLQGFFNGKTVVVVAHRLSTVKNADQIIVMDRGEIVETGTHEQLTSLKGKYFELVSNQLELAKA